MDNITAKAILEGALNYYNIEIKSIVQNHFFIYKGYEIEVEKNGLFKLISDGQVIAPFDNVDELCRFVLL
jgi:hypothetical protein